MKYTVKYVIAALLVTLTLASCEDFLDKPTEDTYNVDNYYLTDAQCLAGVNYLYTSPWYDFQRGYFKVGDILAGNLYYGSSPYMDFTVNGTDEDLINMSYSMWSVIAHSSTVYNNLKDSPASEDVIAQCQGECLTWKAMAYFYLVRSFGEVPIIHDVEEELENGTYNDAVKVWRSDVYEYIIMTLEKAMELLPESSSSGRIDYYCAEGLLAKVYLAKAGVEGSLDADDLAMAASYAKDVIDNSGRELMENYEDIFRLANNMCDESMIAFRWTAEGSVWTAQNSLQCDLGMTGFDEFGDTWGDWTDPTVDLQEAFGIDLLEQTPDVWTNFYDTRLKATMMLPGMKYSYFWADQGGFEYLRFLYDTDYNSSGGQLNSSTGANCVKHLYGNAQDHIDGIGHSAAYMYNSLATHILRLADVYLIYAEAMLGTSGTTTNADAIDAFYQVRHRSVSSYTKPSSLTFDDIWQERRLEFALEGDRWYDYVRRSYYDPDSCVSELLAQKRSYYYGLDDLYYAYYSTGDWTVDSSSMAYYDATTAVNPEAMMKTDPNTGGRYFYMPFPTEDVVLNPNLASSIDGVHVDVRETYSY